MRSSVLILATLALGISALSEDSPDEEALLPAPTSEKITFLGVSTFHLSPSLREHLEIAEGFGIQVHEVMPDSPAELSGLKKNDILIRFNDQLLISPEHLSLLVRLEEGATKANIDLIRKGAQETVEVELGRIERSAEQVRPPLDAHRMSPQQWQEHLKVQQDYWQRWIAQRQSKQSRKTDGEAFQEHESLSVSGNPPAVSVNPGFPVRVFGTEGVIKIDNEEGEVSITHQGEGHEIMIQDRDGNEIYAGPYSIETGIRGLPDEAQAHLEKMKLENLEILAPQGSEQAPERTSSPMPPLSQREEVL